MRRERRPLVRKDWHWFDAQLDMMVSRIHGQIDPHRRVAGLYGQPRGGLPLAVALSHRLHLPLLMEPEDSMVWCDDIVDSGRTLRSIQANFDVAVAVALVWDRGPFLGCPGAIGGELKMPHDAWIVFPWEDPHHAVQDRANYLASRGLKA